MIPYQPRYLSHPPRVLDVPTAWRGIEAILHDLISRFCPDATRALEIGVDYGYSTVALSNFFASVVGVDTFEGDVHAGQRDGAMYARVREALLPYPNIRLVQSNYREFFQSLGRGNTTFPFDLTHIDIVHTYPETYECGLLALNCSRVVIFHDTHSFPDVMRAVTDLASVVQADHYDWDQCHGLGILVR